MITIIIITTIIIVAIIVLLCFYFRQRKYNSFILQNSLCLKQLRIINNRYSFNSDISYDQCYTYDNVNFYDTITCEDYLIYQLQFISKKVIAQIKNIHENKQIYLHYKNEIKTVSDFGNFNVPIGKLNTKKLIAKEKKYFQNNILQEPTTEFILKVTLCCSTITGRIYDEKQTFFLIKIYFCS